MHQLNGIRKIIFAERFFGTVDNPSSATEWALAEMLNQPEVLQKACNELDVVVGKEGLVQKSDLPRLNFIKACTKEAFRLHPITPFNLPHAALSDTYVNGYFIPEGSHLLISRVSRNPRVWDTPLRFKLECHIKNDGSQVFHTDAELHTFIFIMGRRGCPGMLLGSTMTTMLLARLLQGFSWSLPSGSSGIELKENKYDLFLADPLYAVVVTECVPYS